MSAPNRSMKPSGVEWIGDIPEHWKRVRCKYVSEFINGYAFPSSDFDTEGAYPVVRIGDIANGTVRYSSCLRVNDNAELAKYRICIADILVAMSGATVGKVGIQRHSQEDLAYINQRVGIIRSEYPIFLFYVFSTGSFIEYISLMSNFSAQPNVSGETISNWSIPFPDVEEQRAIADYLDKKCAEIDGLAGDIEKQIDILERYKQSVISEAVTKGLDPTVPMKSSGVDWLGNIPTHWDTRRIDHLYSLRVQKVSERDFPALSVTKQGIVPQLDDVAKTNDIDNRKLVRKNDFVINSRSDRRGSCGISNYDGSVSLINTVLYPSGSSAIGKYYNWLFRTTLFADEFYKWGHGIVDDLWSTSWEDMRKISVCIPSPKEQQEIADYLDKKCAEIDALISTKQEQLEKLAEYKKSLIYEYVTGKKEVA